MKEKESTMPTTVPTPAPGHVLLKNPATEEYAVEVDKKTAKLPPKEKEAYFQKEMANMWQAVEVVVAGTGCSWLKAGDKAIGNPEVVTSAQPTPDGKYLIVRESTFKAKW